MRVGNNILGFVVNFLLGIAWASVLIGAITSALSYYYSDGILLSIVSFFIGAIPGFIAVLLLEVIITQKETHLELKKQTALLETLLYQQKVLQDEQASDAVWSPNIPS